MGGGPIVYTDIAGDIAQVIRDERLRQYRDQDSAKWPSGAYDYDEHQGPWLQACAVLDLLKSRGLLKPENE